MRLWIGVLVGLWLLSLGGIGVYAAGDSDAYSDGVAQTRALGYASFVLLSAALCVSPFRRWLRESAKLRRALGLLAACTALLHFEVAMWTSPLSVAEQFEDATLRFGFGAFLVLVLLALTSFPGVVTSLKLRSWKELHRLAYVAWICALLHGLFAPYAWIRGLCAIAAVVLTLAVLRLVPRRNRAASD